MLICGAKLFAQANVVPPSEIKAVFLFNFTGFTEWPPNAFNNATEPLVIGILGENPFGQYLDEVVQNEKKDGHPLMIKHFTRVDDVKNCHILFINKKTPEEINQVINALKGRSILTVSDAKDFVKKGGMIRFYTDNDKVKLQVNVGAVRDGNMVLSSKLLRLAEIFNP
jgi:hypothetical protein